MVYLNFLSFLDRSGVLYNVVVNGYSIRRLEDVLKLGLCPERVVKSLLIRDRRGVLVASIPMSRKLNVTLVSELLGSGIGFVSRNEVSNYGYEAGAVPPVYHRNVRMYLLDRLLFSYPSVFSGSGDPQKLIEIAPTYIVKSSDKPIIIDNISD